MNILVLSTLPHFMTVLHYNQYTSGYIHTIVISTILSILYHTIDSPIITACDYLFAFLVFLYEVKHATDVSVYYMNGAIFVMNICIEGSQYYRVLHSIWHLLSAGKCYYLVYNINIKIKDTLNTLNTLTTLNRVEIDSYKRIMAIP